MGGRSDARINSTLRSLLQGRSNDKSPLPANGGKKVPGGVPNPAMGSGAPVAYSLSNLSPGCERSTVGRTRGMLRRRKKEVRLTGAATMLSKGGPKVACTSRCTNSNCRGTTGSLTHVLGSITARGTRGSCRRRLARSLRGSTSRVRCKGTRTNVRMAVRHVGPISSFFVGSCRAITSPLLQASGELRDSVLPLLGRRTRNKGRGGLLFNGELSVQTLRQGSNNVFAEAELPSRRRGLSIKLLISRDNSVN